MLRRIVLDVLKPHEPRMVQFTAQLSDLEGVTGVTSKLVEMDEHVRTVRVAIEGDDLDYDRIVEEVEELSGSVHSIDEVSCGSEIIDDRWTLSR